MTCIDSHRWFFVNGFFSPTLFRFRIFSSPSPPTSDACISPVLRLGPWSSCVLFLDWWGLRLYVFHSRLWCSRVAWDCGRVFVRLEVGGAWVAPGEISGHVSHHRRTNVKHSLNLNCSALQYTGVHRVLGTE